MQQQIIKKQDNVATCVRLHTIVFKGKKTTNGCESWAHGTSHTTITNILLGDRRTAPVVAWRLAEQV